MEDAFILVALAVGVALFAGSATASANIAPAAGDDPVTDTSGYPVTAEDNVIDLSAYGSDQRAAALLAMIRQFESNNQYNVIYGGSHFSSYAQHPFEGRTSAHTASGAYQFIIRTWDALQRQLGLPDFSPASQDAAALELLRQIGALDAIYNNDFQTAVQLASGQWASLPGSTANQHPKSWATAEAVYLNNLAMA